MNKERFTIGRRSFLGTAAGAALTASAMPLSKPGSAEAEPANRKLRVVLVGTGSRGSSMWGKNLIEKYGDILEMVGLCDKNSKRMEYVKKYMGATCPTYSDLEFDDMLKETQPDRVIVTTPGALHAKYIIRAMELGYDVITEKPMCTDEKMCQDIIDTERRTGRSVIVTFNYRYSPVAEKIKEILMSGEIGQVTSVDFNYYLDIYHGASYYRRWHGFKQHNGSLLVAKSTHHFDLMNWWLSAEPVEVYAYGEIRKYGYNGSFRSERCMTCPHTDKCEFYWDVTKDEHAMNLYVKAESEDGYIRDACVYRGNINVWDTMSSVVRYHNHIMMTYSLNNFMPYEGFRVGFNGTKGRLDVREYHRQPWEVDRLADFRITLNFKDSRTFEIPKGGAGHWGSDKKMQDRILRGSIPDPLGQAAGTRDGALSALIGIGCRRSIEQQKPVKIEEMVKI